MIIIIEAARQEQINKATGEAAAVVAVAEARAKGLQVVANALGVTDAKNAAALSIAEQYVNAFNKLARVNNTLILPSNVGDVSTFVAQVCYLINYYFAIITYRFNNSIIKISYYIL